MTNKVNGFSATGQHLTGSLNVFEVRTLLDIRPTGTATYTAGVAPSYQDTRDMDSQFRLDKLVETISLRGQPVILGGVVTSTETSPTDLPAASGSVTVYSLRFAIEHDKSWDVTGAGNRTLAESLNGVAGFVFTSPTTGNNVSVVAKPF